MDENFSWVSSGLKNKSGTNSISDMEKRVLLPISARFSSTMTFELSPKIQNGPIFPVFSTIISMYRYALCGKGFGI